MRFYEKRDKKGISAEIHSKSISRTNQLNFLPLNELQNIENSSPSCGIKFFIKKCKTDLTKCKVYFTFEGKMSKINIRGD
jgi:hypothetical protein